MSDLTIRVLLPNNRTKTGQLELIDPFTGLAIFGPVPDLGRAAQNPAKAHQNPTRKTTLPYGDTPLGSYAVTGILANGPATTRHIHQYGASGSIVLDPQSGDAAAAMANGRIGLLIHAGRQPNSPTPLPSHLKPTNGCLRMLDDDLNHLIKAIRSNSLLFPGRVNVEVGSVEGPAADIDETVEDTDPPPMTGDIIFP